MTEVEVNEIKVESESNQNGIEISQYITESLNKVAVAEGFNNFTLKIDSGSAVGDGFVGILLKATVKEVDSDKILSVVVKSPPENQVRRQQFGAMALFKREIYIYNEFLPFATKFQQEMKIKNHFGFFNFPKCYFAEFNEEKDEAIIILEDLRDRDFKMWDKFKPVDFEHSKLLISTLGRYHALSFAMKKHKPEAFEKFQQLRDFTSEKFSRDENFCGMIRGNFDQAASTLEGDEKKKNRVLKLKEDVGQLFRDMTDPELCEPYAVLTHGDCWSNNFMFRYQRGKLTDVVLLDWQVTRYCSPVLDLVYFIFVCTDREMRAKHYDEFLNIYYNSLKETLEELGGDASTQFPFTALLRLLKKFGKYGFIISTFLIPMLTTSNDQLPDTDAMANEVGENKDMKAMEDAFKDMMANNSGYKARMRDILNDQIRFGYL